jgi:hypothetical protein
MNKEPLSPDMTFALSALEKWHNTGAGKPPSVGTDLGDPSQVCVPSTAMKLESRGWVTWEGTQIRITPAGLRALERDREDRKNEAYEASIRYEFTPVLNVDGESQDT